VADTTHTLEQPFFVMATQNPIEMEGTYPLPEAQVDRFFFKVNVPYPSTDELNQILERTTGQELPAVEACLGREAIMAMQGLARGVPIATHVREYVTRLVVATHSGRPEATPLAQQFVRYGASPRGGQALILGAKVTALLSGRYNVAFEDVAAIAPAALRHRLILNFDGVAEGTTPDQIIAELLELVPSAQR
jgi:MoxR-like ATPase